MLPHRPNARRTRTLAAPWAFASSSLGAHVSGGTALGTRGAAGGGSGVVFRHARLPNGLTIIGELDAGAHTSAAGFFVRTGARDEAPDVMGVSHFLEHMMFKGTPTRSASEINQAFDRLGARANAYTSSESTVFYFATLAECFAEGLDVLADMMRPALREADFDTERGVILEEIAMYQDDPSWVLYERAMEEHYARHGLGHRVLGTQETIGALRIEQMREYFTRRYSADNTVLAVAGNVDWERTLDHAARLCGSWNTTGVGRELGTTAPAGRAFETHDDKVSRAYRIMLTSGPGADDDRRYAAYMMTMLLGLPDNSRFHWALIEPGLAEEAECSYDPKDGVGDLRVFVVCEPDRLERVWEIVQREIAQLRDGVREDDVQRLRAKVATGATLAGERPEGRMQRIGRVWQSLGRHTTLEEELERINRVSVQDIRELIDQTDWTIATVGTLRP
jgi:predicted Zn-dependent peptidase